jgi:hypothetical protein
MWRSAYWLPVAILTGGCQSAPASPLRADAGSQPDGAAGSGGRDGGDAAAPCGDTASDPLNCGTCGRSCLGGACLNGQCQAVPVVQGLSLTNWDGIDPWSLTLVGDSIYYSDNVLGAGYVWKVAKAGGIAAPVIDIQGAAGTAEYCLGGGGGENARWLTSSVGQVYWRGCMNRLRDLDTSTGLVSRIGELDVSFITSTSTQIFCTRQTMSDASIVGEVVAFSTSSGTQNTIGSYSGSPGYLAADDTFVFWSDTSSGTIMKVSQKGGPPEMVAPSPYPQGIALDADYVYWTDSSQGAILRVLKSGGNGEPLASGQDTPVQIAVDGNFVYWTDTSDLGLGSVMRASKSGGSATPLATGLGTASDQHRGPWAIAIDDVAVYWTEIYGRDALMRVAK